MSNTLDLKDPAFAPPISHYTKFILPLLTAAITAFLTVGEDDSWVRATLIVSVAVLTALGQYFATNALTGFWSYAKFWVALLAVVAQSLLVIIPVGGDLAAVDRNQWLVLILAVFNAIATGILPNSPSVKRIVAYADARDGTQTVTSLPEGPEH